MILPLFMLVLLHTPYVLSIFRILPATTLRTRVQSHLGHQLLYQNPSAISLSQHPIGDAFKIHNVDEQKNQSIDSEYYYNERCHILKQYLTDAKVEPDDKLESMCQTCFDESCISCIMSLTEAQQQIISKDLEIEDLEEYNTDMLEDKLVRAQNEPLELKSFESEELEENYNHMVDAQNQQQKTTSLGMGHSFFHFKPTRLTKNSLLRTQLT